MSDLSKSIAGLIIWPPSHSDPSFLPLVTVTGVLSPPTRVRFFSHPLLSSSDLACFLFSLFDFSLFFPSISSFCCSLPSKDFDLERLLRLSFTLYSLCREDLSLERDSCSTETDLDRLFSRRFCLSFLVSSFSLPYSRSSSTDFDLERLLSVDLLSSFDLENVLRSTSSSTDAERLLFSRFDSLSCPSPGSPSLNSDRCLASTDLDLERLRRLDVFSSARCGNDLAASRCLFSSDADLDLLLSRCLAVSFLSSLLFPGLCLSSTDLDLER
uniref:Uncharacterized protein n=1 Tax=Opuntia streptacantha TaxID=393608 RepID=A0A7C9ER80_OPUST